MYKGMAVGGPLAGRILECEYHRYFHAVEKETVAVFDPNAPIGLSKDDYAFYNHSIGLRGVFSIDLWLHDRMTVEQAFSEIFNFYHKHAKKE